MTAAWQPLATSLPDWQRTPDRRLVAVEDCIMFGSVDYRETDRAVNLLAVITGRDAESIPPLVAELIHLSNLAEAARTYVSVERTRAGYEGFLHGFAYRSGFDDAAESALAVCDPRVVSLRSGS